MIKLITIFFVILAAIIVSLVMVIPANAATWHYSAPKGISVAKVISTNGYGLKWNAVRGPSGQIPPSYTVATYQLNGVKVDQFTVKSTSTLEYGRGGKGLHSGWTYKTWVWANGGPSAPPHAILTQTTLATSGVNNLLRGTQRDVWAKASLLKLGAPLTSADVQTMYWWFENEGTPHAYNNPLGLQTPWGGSWATTENGDPLADRIQHYPSPNSYAPAFNKEMRHGGPDDAGDYHFIVAALMSGKGMIGNTSADLKYDLMQYSGDGYDSIPADYLNE